jgi:hypothetical protein
MARLKVALVLCCLTLGSTHAQSDPDSEVELIPTNTNAASLQESRPVVQEQESSVNQLGSQIFFDYNNYGEYLRPSCITYVVFTAFSI